MNLHLLFTYLSPITDVLIGRTRHNKPIRAIWDLKSPGAYEQTWKQLHPFVLPSWKLLTSACMFLTTDWGLDYICQNFHSSSSPLSALRGLKFRTNQKFYFPTARGSDAIKQIWNNSYEAPGRTVESAKRTDNWHPRDSIARPPFRLGHSKTIEQVLLWPAFGLRRPTERSDLTLSLLSVRTTSTSPPPTPPMLPLLLTSHRQNFASAPGKDSDQ